MLFKTSFSASHGIQEGISKVINMEIPGDPKASPQLINMEEVQAKVAPHGAKKLSSRQHLGTLHALVSLTLLHN